MGSFFSAFSRPGFGSFPETLEDRETERVGRGAAVSAGGLFESCCGAPSVCGASSCVSCTWRSPTPPPPCLSVGSILPGIHGHLFPGKSLRFPVFLREAAARHRSVVLPSVFPVLFSRQFSSPWRSMRSIGGGIRGLLFSGCVCAGYSAASGTLRCRTPWNILQVHCVGTFCARAGAGRLAASSVFWCFPGADLCF